MQKDKLGCEQKKRPRIATQTLLWVWGHKIGFAVKGVS
jgi:hypothetical protein